MQHATHAGKVADQGQRIRLCGPCVHDHWESVPVRQRELMLEGVNELLAAYRENRRVDLNNSVAPALVLEGA